MKNGKKENISEKVNESFYSMIETSWVLAKEARFVLKLYLMEQGDFFQVISWHLKWDEIEIHFYY